MEMFRTIAVRAATRLLASSLLLGVSGIAAAQVLTVNRTGDASGTQCLVSGCSLRQAITVANATPAIETIVFNIPACGVRNINITGPTLRITRPVTIDGTTQPQCGVPPPGDRTSMIEIRGPGVSAFPGGLVMHGLVLEDGSDGSIIQGLALNSFSGFGIGISSDSNFINDVKVGTDPTGRLARPNNFGIGLNNANNNQISFSIISGNVSTGINVLADSTIISENLIGVNVDGDPLGNGGDGISTFDADNNDIGFAIGLANTIANNGGAGVRIGLGGGNTVFANSISNNNGLGIVLEGAANGGQVAPVITGASRQFELISTNPLRFALRTTVTGTLANAPAGTRVDLYGSDACDPSGFGEGQRYVTNLAVTNGTFSMTTSAAVGANVSAIARTTSGNTSRFSNCRLVTQPFNFPTLP